MRAEGECTRAFRRMANLKMSMYPNAKIILLDKYVLGEMLPCIDLRRPSAGVLRSRANSTWRYSATKVPRLTFVDRSHLTVQCDRFGAGLETSSLLPAIRTSTPNSNRQSAVGSRSV